NLVQFIGFCISEKHGLCCVSEYMQGKSLRHLFDNKRQSLSWPKEKIQIAMDIAAATVYLHSLRPRIIYHNIKAEKVLLTNRGVAKLSLHGRICRHERKFEGMTLLYDDIEWSAPEFITENENFDEKVDVYAFGVFLTELDTRDVPFAAEKAAMMMPRTEFAKKIVLGQLRPALSNSCPPCIKHIVNQCLKHDASMRPSSERVLHMLREARLELLDNT
ncbi:hypothetical protein As57867_005252, partial [Aphanomyces stellatus]